MIVRHSTRWIDGRGGSSGVTEGSDVIKATEVSDVRPFRAELPQADLDQLQGRLAEVRWPDEPPGATRRYGVPREYVRELVEHWRTDFDWRAQESRLNAQPQYTTTIDDQSVHFIHARSPEPDALPLICTHGWPMSVFEYPRQTRLPR